MSDIDDPAMQAALRIFEAGELRTKRAIPRVADIIRRVDSTRRQTPSKEWAMSESDDLAMRAAREIEEKYEISSIIGHDAIPEDIADIIRRVVVEPMENINKASVSFAIKNTIETLSRLAGHMPVVDDAVGETWNQVKCETPDHA